jgi:hypothetical protein
MPNWCENKVVVYGAHDDVTAFTQMVRGHQTSFSLAQIVPEPPSDGDSWYNWRIEHWGTKWDTNNCIDNGICGEGEDASIEYRFDTAWSPPLEAMDVLAEKCPTLKIVIHYFEGGMEFGGTREYAEGGCINDDDDMETAYFELNGRTLAEARAEWEEENGITEETENDDA